MLSIFFIGIALSMDAFSLAVGIGIMNLDGFQKFSLASMIGLMHFIMPQMGLLLGNHIFDFFLVNVNIFNILIFIYLGVIMLISKTEPHKIFHFSFVNILILSVCVSIDSFSVGLGLNAVTNHNILAGMVFALSSGIISYFGLNLGEKVVSLLQEKAKCFGGMLLLMLAVVNLFKELF